MKSLIIDKKITKNFDSFSVYWFITNPECKDISFNISDFTTLQEIRENELSIKESILTAVNNYFGEEIYQLDSSLIPQNFYEKTQEDGRLAINNLMRDLLIQSQSLNLPRQVNQEIEKFFKPVTDAIILGWWRTAKEQCELLQPFVISNPFVNETLYEKIYTTIVNYISENYPY